ncbi:MAG: DedA family protein [Spirochaetia bacterium]|jgi:membrane protein DedA with SNARE-associated domain|nr:DedA family protein [Spirochaetia bacterium]
MEFTTDLLLNAAQYVHFISFALLFLAGFNLPVSEDLVFIVSASIAATIVPENTPLIFAGCFTGAYVSDIIAYCTGRFVIGGVLLKHPVLSKLTIVKRGFSEKRMLRLKNYFDKYGLKTLFFGRFVPLRNILFMTCGLINLRFRNFLIVDFCALACTSAILFTIGYSLGENYDEIFPYIKRYKTIVIVLIACIFIFLNRKRLLRLMKRIRSAGDTKSNQ